MKNKKNVLIILLGLFMSQSSIILGINFSFSDVFLIFYLFYLSIHNEKWIHTRILIYYFLLVAYLLILSVFITPLLWEIEISLKSLLVEIMKITILFLYLNLGIQLYATNKLKILLNSFVYASILISAFGLIINHAGGAIKPYLFFGGFRFKGLLNDPNLFAVSQVIALSLLRDMNLSSIKKYLYLTIILSGIILSGSKTGLICLIVFMIITFLKVIRQITSKDIVKYISVLLIVLVFIYFSKGIVVPESFLDSVNRMSQLITDSTTSINESGSSRGNAWNIAIKIIYNSLFLGTGLGTYLLISKNIFNTNVLAHNTYLQLTAEWGLLITLIIVTLILIKLLFILFNYKKIDDTFLGELILYFLIGSFSLSLNNSRLFWLLLGPFLMIKLVNKKMKR